MDPPRPRQRIRALARMSVCSTVLSGLLNGLRGDTTCHPSAGINYGIMHQYSVFEERESSNMMRGSERQVGTPTEVIRYSRFEPPIGGGHRCDQIKKELPRLASASTMLSRP
ncbi:hypothetical protein ARMSODRAFT_1024989 [Armillaria solidipes]|uniref:Uncharacterized protein n=1 Tax=Armillaria solidipes TaxID=1076256 RepID=A0A2H3AXI2_9AGAR|nr:hypothetical protein ARMSODRAFT_1024989 [Armillaria solidipes]